MSFSRVFVGSILALGVPQFALAHAVLVHSAPQRDEVVHTATGLHVQLKFNSRVDGPHCTLSLAKADGKAGNLPLSKQVAPNELDANAPALEPGTYSLRWQALASDGHITRGEIPFRVQ